MSTQAPERPALQDEAAIEPQTAPDGLTINPAHPSMTALAALLATSAAAWMAGGLFRAPSARLIGILGAAIGVGLVMLSYRSRRPSILQYFVLPAAALAGALLVVIAPRGGDGNLIALVGEALSAGGLKQPPIAFDPGWRFIFVVVFALLGAASASLAASLDRAFLAVLVPVPVMMAAALVQPRSSEIVSTAVAICLVFAAQSLTFGNELARRGASSGVFEVRRLARGGAMLVLLVAAVVGISRADFLFPETARDQVIPPQRPKSQPLAADRVLFSVEAERPGPWRLGVLDTYDGRGWLMPAFDTGRFVTVGSGDPIANPVNTDAGTQQVAFRIADMPGHVVPGVANPLEIRGHTTPIDLDPLTQTLRLTDSRAFRGLTYTIEAPLPPGGAALSTALSPPESIRPFLTAPPPPNEVVLLLTEAPQNPWDRLQFVRTRFYEKVIAAGAGSPRDVPPQRVVELLSGVEGSPFEITASEALLARWAGVPSRVGYGYYSGEHKEGRFEVRPKHGATWLEVYFEGHGWVPIVGVPPRARSSLDEAKQNEDPNVQPTEELALVVYVPVERSSVKLLYVAVRYWLGILVPALLGVALVWWLFPFAVKTLRRYLRRRWAYSNGPRERIAVAYSEFRDICTDLNIGSIADTPLDFANRIQKDDEHEELAWLVTRALWGDLRRDLNDVDAAAAEELATSVTRRLRAAQPAITRILAIGARGSLRTPHSLEVPNLWPRWAEQRVVRRFLRRLSPRKAFAWVRKLLPVQLLILMILGSCATSAAPPSRDGRLPDRLVPGTIGGVTIRGEPEGDKAFSKAGSDSLVKQGRVFTIRAGDDVEGSIQFGAFRGDARERQRELREGVLRSIGTGRFEVTRIGGERVWEARTAEQRMLLWFAPGASYYQLMVTRSAYDGADALFRQILEFRSGASGSLSPLADYDPRRGEEE